MRDYKFRGKRKDNGEWVTGSLTIEYDGTCNINYWVSKLVEPENNYWEPVHEMVEVITGTVGQFIGLKDKNGIELYENDIILWDGRKAVIEWLPRMAGYYAMWRGEGVHFHDMQQIVPAHGGLCHIDIIGNIYDHPHLLNPLKGERTNTMKDPNVKAEGEVNDNESANAQESASQDKAMEATPESAEEGGAEG